MILIPVLAAFAVGACGDTSAGDEGELSVATTTGIAADIAREVGGDRVEVTQIVPNGSSPHSYAPSAREQAEVDSSDLLVYFHPALEEALPIEAAERSFAIADHVDHSLEVGAGEHHDEGREGGEPGEHGHAGEDEHAGDEHAHEEGSPDPHVWLDPTAIAAALPALAEELAALDPAGAEGYEQRAIAYAEELAALDTELAGMVEAVPAEERKLVTSHESMSYFANRYGFEIVGAPFGVSPEAEASAAGVAELITAVRETDVSAVFAQQGDNPEVLRLIAGEAGVEVVDDLLVESLGEQAGSYLEMMRYTTSRITESLSG